MSTNIQAKANLIWEVATKLVGVYKPHEYGEVIHMRNINNKDLSKHNSNKTPKTSAKTLKV